VNRFRLLHVTEFEYDAPVSESYNELRLRPRDDEWQSCVSFRLATRPTSRPTGYRDWLGNWAHRFNVLPAHRLLRVEAESLVMTQVPPPPRLDGVSLAIVDAQANALLEQHYDFLGPSAYVSHLPELAALGRDAEAESGGGAARFALAASALVHHRFRYEKGATHVHSRVADALAAGAGVCQDFTHLLLGIVRARGLPARYVSGYLIPSSQDGAEAVSGGQASHAWAEVFVPDTGWIGLDPTLGEPVSERHVRVAYGRDYADVPPVRGVYRGRAGQRLSVDVCLRPAIDDVGHARLREVMAGPPPTAGPAAPTQGQGQ
jgi:transglutaminase-like putative cysteine protease